MMKYITYTCHSLSIFKPLIIDVQLLPIFYPYMFPTFTYNSSRAWRKDSIGHIIEFPTTFSKFFDRSVFKFYIFKSTYSSSWLIYTSKNIQPSHIITHAIYPFRVYDFVLCNHIFILPLSITHHSHNILC